MTPAHPKRGARGLLALALAASCSSSIASGASSGASSAGSASGAASRSSSRGAIPIAVHLNRLTTTTPRTFLAHGWEPWTATGMFEHFGDPAFATTVSHLRGQTVRFGGISADWLSYVVNKTVSAPCSFMHKPFAPGTKGCAFSTGSLDYLLGFLQRAGIETLFDLNELAGRNCTQPSPGGGEQQKSQWCGDRPAAWDTAPVRALLQHVHDRGMHGVVGFERVSACAPVCTINCPYTTTQYGRDRHLLHQSQ